MTGPPPAPASIVIERTIEWFDTDASGHYHHATAFRLAEAAETALLKKLGLVGLLGRVPRVQLHASFTTPLYFGDTVSVRIEVSRLGRSSITYRYTIDAESGCAVSGEIVAVLLDRPAGRPIPWSARQRELLLGAAARQPDPPNTPAMESK